MVEIETERVELRMFKMDDLEALSRIFGDPEVVRHLGTGQPAPREETEVALRSIIRHWERHGFGRWAAVHKGTRELIGYGGLRSFEGEPELVYLLSKPYWGQGLATEMARACLRFGFEERGFERIIALAKPANIASQRVLGKVGMIFEKAANVYGMDVFCYAISHSAYRAGEQSQTQRNPPIVEGWWCSRLDSNQRPTA